MQPLRGLAEYVLHAVKRLLQALIIRVEPIGQACNVLPSGLELFLGLLERAAHPDGRRRGTLARHALCLLCTTDSFRSSLHGFNRMDVVQFIQKTTSEHELELRRLAEERTRQQVEL